MHGNSAIAWWGQESQSQPQPQISTSSAPLIWSPTCINHHLTIPPHPLYRSITGITGASSSTSLATSTDSSMSASPIDAQSRTPSPPLLHPQLASFPDPPINIVQRSPLISQAPTTLHSRHASVQTTLSRSHSTASTYEYDDAEPASISRPISPVSLATTFGGAPRNNHRSRTTSGERAISPSEPSHDHLSTCTRSDSFTSDRSLNSNRTSFSISQASQRRSFRMSLPPVGSRKAAVTPDFESDDPMDGMRWLTPYGALSKNQDIDREIRSTPGVMGLGEGWTGGPARKKSKRRSVWFGGKLKRKEDGAGVDPLALWTVPEEAKSQSPLRSAWNRSRAKFGASVPVLTLSGGEEKVGKRDPQTIGQKARSVFSPSRTDLPNLKRRGSEPNVLMMATTTTDQSSPPIVRMIPIQEIPNYRRVPVQPHPILPRSTSLPLEELDSRLTTDEAPQDYSGLSRNNTFGKGRNGPLGGERSREVSSSTFASTVRAGEQFESPPRRRPTLLSKLKSRLSGFSDSSRQPPSPTKKKPRLDLTPVVLHSPRLVLNPANTRSVISKPRPVSMIPLAPEADDLPEATEIPQSRSTDIRSFLKRIGRRSTFINLSPTPNLGRSPETDKQRRRRSLSGSLRGLQQWSMSDSNLLRTTRPSGNEDLEELVSQLKLARRSSEVGLAPPIEFGGNPHDVAEDSNGSSRFRFGTSSSSATFSSSATPPTPALETPISPRFTNPLDTSSSPHFDGAPRLPSLDFAWAARTDKHGRRRSSGDLFSSLETAEMKLTRPGIRRFDSMRV